MESTGVYWKPIWNMLEGHVELLLVNARHRTKLSDQHTSVGNRLPKVLEDANIQLSTVISDIMGVSGRRMLRAIAAGERDPLVLSALGDQRGAQSLLAELGPDMAQFPSADHVASWAGMAPGNAESAGKRRSGKTPKGRMTA